jgi:acyl carrier protein
VLTADGIENQVRRIVARHFGVSSALLAPAVSLRDDLASDGRALADLVVAVEDRLGVRMPERVLDEIRSYGELVDASIEAIRKRRADVVRHSGETPAGRVQVIGPQGLVVERAGALTPYLLETLRDDVRRVGAGASLVVTLADATTDDQVTALRDRLRALERRGVTLRVVRTPDSTSRR